MISYSFSTGSLNCGRCPQFPGEDRTLKTYAEILEEIVVKLLELENLLPSGDEDPEGRELVHHITTNVMLLLDRARQDGI